MPHYMHQWTYKDRQLRAMATRPQEREEVVRIATEAFGGRLHQFFFALGEFDGISISEFPDEETAMACIMSIVSQGALANIRTTALLTPREAKSAMRRAHEVINGYHLEWEREAALSSH